MWEVNTDLKISVTNKLFIYLFIYIDFKERERGRHRTVASPIMHSVVDSHMCPHQRSNPQLWHIETML